MKYEYYEKYISKTKKRYDATPIFHEPKVFANLIKDLSKPFKKFDVIVGIDALGFILGAAMAHSLKKKFVPVRKGGKLPGNVIRTSFVDYSKKKKTFEINKNSIRKGEKVLIVDEWIETGSQMKAAIKLIEKQGGKIIGISALRAHKTERTKILFDKYNCQPISIK